MGYYRESCSPYDVQAKQGGKFDFATVKERYETTKPIQGKRKDQNIRPINRRDRSYERIIKVSDMEYYVTFDNYRWRKEHNKAITWKMVDDMEYMTIHTPRQMWGTPPTMDLYPRSLSSSSTFWFYDFNMPHGFSMVNHYVSKYVRHNGKHYTIEQGDITFIRRHSNTLNKLGENNWQPLVVHRQFKHHIDRAKTKELKELVKPFLAYYDIMGDIVEDKWEYGSPIVRAINKGEYGRATPEQAVALFKPREDGNIHDEWLGLVENYKHRIFYSKKLSDSTWTKNQVWREDLPNILYTDLFAVAKPCKEIEVPLGELCIDRYKSWYR
jgi:hypothetical protein